ncbi:MAG TPA: hypothetical protein PLS62_12175, partial [Desulfobacteraceae bacterium]|nr:hypothetical protein [Desulfobacteraceae bacterium]
DITVLHISSPFSILNIIHCALTFKSRPIQDFSSRYGMIRNFISLLPASGWMAGGSCLPHIIGQHLLSFRGEARNLDFSKFSPAEGLKKLGPFT